MYKTHRASSTTLVALALCLSLILSSALAASDWSSGVTVDRSEHSSGRLVCYRGDPVSFTAAMSDTTVKNAEIAAGVAAAGV